MITDAGSATSLVRLLDPDVLADPYPLYHSLQETTPVMWDRYLHAWVVTRYADVARVFARFSADRTPSPETLAKMGMSHLSPIAAVMIRQMLFLDPPQHGRVRGLAACAFTPRRVEELRNHIQHITDEIIDGVAADGGMEVMETLANVLPAIVTAEMLGVPTADHGLLKQWSTDFAEMLGNFQHNPGRTDHVLRSVAEMTDYFQSALHSDSVDPGGLLAALTAAEIDGDRLSEAEVIANVIVTMVGGQETTTNLIGNGLYSLLRHPQELAELRSSPDVLPSAIEELLRYESPSQHTARRAPRDTEIAGRNLEAGQAVIIVMGAANRDPARFADPDRLDLRRENNRHLAFGWARHFCFGAPLARMEARIAFATLLRRFSILELEPGPIHWRPNLGLRGLCALNIRCEP